MSTQDLKGHSLSFNKNVDVLKKQFYKCNIIFKNHMSIVVKSINITIIRIIMWVTTLSTQVAAWLL